MANPPAALLNALTRLGFSLSDVTKGCDECAAPWQNAEFQRQVMRGAVLSWILAQIAGENPSVRGWYRCGPCNERRGGAKASAHLNGDAIDRDYTTAGAARIVAAVESEEFRAALAQVLGFDGFGFIVYPPHGGRRAVHSDARSNRPGRTFVDVQT